MPPAEDSVAGAEAPRARQASPEEPWRTVGPAGGHKGPRGAKPSATRQGEYGTPSTSTLGAQPRKPESKSRPHARATPTVWQASKRNMSKTLGTRAMACMAGAASSSLQKGTVQVIARQLGHLKNSLGDLGKRSGGTPVCLARKSPKPQLTELLPRDSGL